MCSNIYTDLENTMNVQIKQRVKLNTLSPITLSATVDLGALRTDMLRFARLQLRDAAAAEDAVQEALTAAIARLDQFENRSELKTWICAILKNKIIDLIRERTRSGTNAQAEATDAERDSYEEGALFDDHGRWQEECRPSHWGDPEESFSRRQFWDVLEACLYRLPESRARVFMMREVLGFTTEEICVELAISPENCGVLLHRARMALRLCLEERWFRSDGQVHAL